MFKKILAAIIIIIILLGGGAYLYARSIVMRGTFDPEMSTLSNLAKKDADDKSTVKIDWDKFNGNSSNASLKTGEEVISVEQAKEALGIKKDAEDKIKNSDKYKSNKVKNVAVFGIDDFEGGGRSDSIIILSIDSETKEIKIHSILRDSYVDIPGHGMDKINHAYAFGGPLLAIKTINTNFDLNITEYISVSFNSLPQVVDYLGGVPISLSDAEANQLKLSPGINVLNGQQALSYSRIRYIDSDVQRSGRQREIVMGVLTKLLDLPVAEIPGTAGELMSLTKTNLNPDEVIALGTKAVTGRYGVKQSLSPKEFSGDMINGVYYNVFDIKKETDIIHSILFGE